MTGPRREFLNFSPPYIGQEEIDEVVDSLRSGWITTGPKVKLFEKHFADYIGAPAAIAVSSGTAAMQVALAALGIGEGDEVITTPMTFCSTVHVIEQAGAVPVLVDIEPVTLNLDPDLLEQALVERKRKVAALLPVHLAGQPCDLDAIYSLASDNHLCVIEDAAHALPARYGGNLVGSIREDLRGHATCFSFYATKNLTTAEGGMITTTAGIEPEARTWSQHGMSRDAYRRYEEGGSWSYAVVHPGFKANMADIQAAIGIHQLGRLDDMHARRRQIATRYTEALGRCAELQTPSESAGTTHAWHLYLLRLNLDTLSIDRDRFIHELTERNIGTSVHFIPIHLHPYYRDRYGYKPDDLPVAYGEFLRLISLPLYPRMSDEDVDDVIEAVLDVVAKHRR